MNSKNNRGGCWPTGEQVLLLRAALLQGEDAIAAWKQWKKTVDFESLDTGSYRLLPLLYRNLSAHGVHDTLMAKLKGVYRRTWYNNQLLFHKILAVLHSFHQAGIQTMLLKGAVLVLDYYQDYGIRPMDDFDVLVRTADAPATISLLKTMGWITPEIIKPETLISRMHAISFKNESGQNLDLHWHVLAECLHENADYDFWTGAISLQLGDVSTYALNPTDQLLHACIHGARWNLLPPIRWVADAMTIINSSQAEIDWERLLTQAEQRRLVLRLKETLTILRELLDAPIPLSILQRLQDKPISKFERLEYIAFSGEGQKMPVLWTLIIKYSYYVRLTNTGDTRLSFLDFIRYLQNDWCLEHLWQVPFLIIIKGLKRIWIDIVYTGLVKCGMWVRFKTLAGSRLNC